MRLPAWNRRHIGTRDVLHRFSVRGVVHSACPFPPGRAKIVRGDNFALHVADDDLNLPRLQSLVIACVLHIFSDLQMDAPVGSKLLFAPLSWVGILTLNL